MHELIATPLFGGHFVLRPGAGNGVRLPRAAYDVLAATPANAVCPPWLADAAGRAFGLDLAASLLADIVLVPHPSPLGYSRIATIGSGIPKVTVQVLPFTAGAHAALSIGPMTVLGLTRLLALVWCNCRVFPARSSSTIRKMSPATTGCSCSFRRRREHPA